ncbi:hypothetical protein C1752_02890 [Acaryochloris thomasi RCC1774]|uniref:Roadblock/LAMTOR2 domain-containing protein n=1 Tax=Acaryochloris thomasi RCC1774 TaxID=1764569 RepID=A0A2W1JHF6_9CYAN|nr:hypothetical protein [Acaryochloris thomasi]PZD72989.1 hypothetical protein C1752_02890 [Acaryochloris thomasi RCC1774]
MLTDLGQLIYTSFPGAGLKRVCSNQIPLDIQDAFLHQVVYKNWNSYNPPSSGEQAVYLYQPNLESCIFGWLYSDSIDEHNRHIPYFLGYYLENTLNTSYLQQVLTCIQKGPIGFWNYSSAPDQYPNLVSIEDVNTYDAAREGLHLSSDFCDTLHVDLGMEKELNFFNFSKRESSQAIILIDEHLDREVDDGDRDLLREEESKADEKPAINTSELIELILQNLIQKPLEIQSAFLVSAEGQLLTPAMNIDKDSALIIAGTMIYLAQSTSTELQWEKIEKICIQGTEGYMILASCTPDCFLLIQANKVLMGLLDGEVNRVIQKIRAILLTHQSDTHSSEDETNIKNLSQVSSNSKSTKSKPVMYRGNPIQREP